MGRPYRYFAVRSVAFATDDGAVVVPLRSASYRLLIGPSGASTRA